LWRQEIASARYTCREKGACSQKQLNRKLKRKYETYRQIRELIKQRKELREKFRKLQDKIELLWQKIKKYRRSNIVNFDSIDKDIERLERMISLEALVRSILNDTKENCLD